MDADPGREAPLVLNRPRLGIDDAARVALRWFGVEGSLAELAGERDQNFQIDARDGSRFVLKIPSPREDPSALDMRDALLDHLECAGLDGVPRAIRPLADAPDSLSLPGGATTPRLLTWLPGRPLARVTPHTEALLGRIGAALGRLDRALEPFDHEGAHRTFEWSPAGWFDAARTNVEHVGDPGRRTLLESRLERASREATPRLADVPRQVIHGDANDWNVLILVRHGEPLDYAGIVDFGDASFSPRVAEPCIAAAYAAARFRDPLAAATAILRGYGQARPLGEDEAETAWDLIGLRLCASVAIAARNRKVAPDDPYLTISEQAAWRTLERMDGIHPRLARAAIRGALGHEPHPESVRVAAFLKGRRGSFAPVLDELEEGAACIVDLSVDAPPLSEDPDDTAAATRAIERVVRDSGARVGIGRYDEVRVCYDAPLFDAEGGSFPERRTVHLGIDLFARAGTEVRAPLDGEVFGLRDNAGRLDYGPTVVLRHETPDGLPFFTLFGHLDRASVERLETGRRIERGEAFARIGAPPENGDWPPHVHVQLIVDMLDRDGEFPGVAAPSARSLWLSLCPPPLDLLGLDDRARAPATPDRDALRAARDAHVSPALGLSYDAPLVILRGRGATLFDAAGQAYLDTVNNVCHVGHAHPRVAGAIARQSSVLNTNTRYLHPLLPRYTERLLSLLPDPLSFLFLVCSGSEANELALRLARARTGRRDIVCQDGAYHGNTGALIDISPYKHSGPGGEGPPPHVHVVPLPDPYRGIHRGRDTGDLYAAGVERLFDELIERGRPPAAFIAESLPGCAGQIVPPGGYLARTFEAVRSRGGVAIADEVQTGFGRPGEAMFAFQAQGALPDVVTLGKPIGNGHPLAAVACTREVAEAFLNGMEYFNTFGGNPVSCAAGMAVLDVIEDEGLQARALEVGARFVEGLREVASRREAIGDVRGMGLFLGVELVRDRDSREPDAPLARYVVERMKERAILASADGVDRNVLKIKPPLCFSATDADRYCAELDRILSESPARR